MPTSCVSYDIVSFKVGLSRQSEPRTGGLKNIHCWCQLEVSVENVSWAKLPVPMESTWPPGKHREGTCNQIHEHASLMKIHWTVGCKHTRLCEAAVDLPCPGRERGCKNQSSKDINQKEGRTIKQRHRTFSLRTLRSGVKRPGMDETVGATATKLHGTTLHLANCSKQLYIWQLYNWQQASGIWHHLATMCCNCTCFSCTDPLCSANNSGSQHGSSPSSQWRASWYTWRRHFLLSASLPSWALLGKEKGHSKRHSKRCSKGSIFLLWPDSNNISDIFAETTCSKHWGYLMIHLKQSGEHVAFSCNGQTSHGIASYEGSWHTTGPPHCMWQGSAQLSQEVTMGHTWLSKNIV